ncbi:zinc finger, CCHC-type containing protein [Tanacetum coccineum]
MSSPPPSPPLVVPVGFPLFPPSDIGSQPTTSPSVQSSRNSTALVALGVGIGIGGAVVLVFVCVFVVWYKRRKRRRRRLLLDDPVTTGKILGFLVNGRKVSLINLEDLTTRFLAQFFPPRRTAKLGNDILMFQQHHGESLSEAWTHFKDLLRKVPHHGLDLWLQV